MLRRGAVELNHDLPVVRHPGARKTHQLLHQQYWWPRDSLFVAKYMKGCATCQANKPITHHNPPPLNPITLATEPEPFQTIAVDFITKLPHSKAYDSIMMITDHNCIKAVILIPCQEMIRVQGVAQLFKDQVFPFIRLPKKIILDRDPQFMLIFWQELCLQLGVTQNLSTAYHPQTDGQAEKINQHMEMALWIYCNFQQDDWADWLLIVQYALNACPSNTTKRALYKLWMGFIPRAHQPDQSSMVPQIEHHKDQLK
jgi:hypothetical protein